MIAVAATIGLYGLFVAVEREPLPSAAERLPTPGMRPLPAPERLPAAPGFSSVPRAASLARPPAAPTTVRVRLAGVPALVRDADAGVAVFQAETFANLQWLPLSGGEAGDGAITVSATAAPGSRLIATLALDRATARHGYLTRREFAVPAAADGGTLTVDLPATVAAVSFALPPTARDAGPLRLLRSEDPQWLPMTNARAGLRLAIGEQLSMPLGEGSYELRDPLQPDLRQTFTVPETTNVVLSPALTRARDGRR